MSATDKYKSPEAFRRALSDRLRVAARQSPWRLAELQRQVGYDRLLARLYSIDGGWVVKGATALLARKLAVRASLDVDLYRAAALEVAESDIRRAVAVDLSDWFSFELRTTAALKHGISRFGVTARIGRTPWTSFHIDLAGGNVEMTALPETALPVADGMIPEVVQVGYRVYPLVDHVADKAAATYERHGEADLPSTRYKDLVDLVAIVQKAPIEADAQAKALRSEYKRRGLALPERFDVPSGPLWGPGYAAEAKKSRLKEAPTLDSALDIVRPFLDPLLRGTARGAWSPADQSWIGEPGEIRGGRSR
ncbi:MAG: nucleotidyl transferase AbiEii/AbiGii toxin family protein [Actinomycetota bacterium]|nr:nucleotidyl transferase AbiEii/AbiGii toxin family protein [Actinomycetota bacterium]